MLTAQQSEFVKYYVSTGGNGAEAARLAGYSPESARKIAYQLMDKPHVQQAIREEQQGVISGRLASKSIAVLEAVLDDPEAPLRIKVDAAKTILDRAGLVARPDVDKFSDIPIIEQLEKHAAYLDGLIANNALIYIVMRFRIENIRRN